MFGIASHVFCQVVYNDVNVYAYIPLLIISPEIVPFELHPDKKPLPRNYSHILAFGDLQKLKLPLHAQNFGKFTPVYATGTLIRERRFVFVG